MVKKITTESKAKGIKVLLKPGNMLVYSGCELEHWRKSLKVSLADKFFYIITIKKHLVHNKTFLISDPHLGLPSWFKN